MRVAALVAAARNALAILFAMWYAHSLIRTSEAQRIMCYVLLVRRMPRAVQAIHNLSHEQSEHVRAYYHYGRKTLYGGSITVGYVRQRICWQPSRCYCTVQAPHHGSYFASCFAAMRPCAICDARLITDTSPDADSPTLQSMYLLHYCCTYRCRRGTTDTTSQFKF